MPLSVPPEALALLAAACWAATSLLSASPAQRLGAFAFTRWRMGFAALLLWTIALATGGWRELTGSATLWLALSGLIGIFIGDTALFACMNRLGPRRAGVLFATHAIFSAFLAWWWLGETLLGWSLLGSGLVVAGVMLAIALGKRGDEDHRWEKTHGALHTGIALGLLAALCQSMATLMLKPLMSTGLDAVAASAVRTSAAFLAHAGLLGLGVGLARSRQPLRPVDAGYTFASAALGMALGMTLVLQAMERGNAGVVAILSSMTPVLVLLLLWIAYRRRPAPGAWVGALLAVLGTALVLAPDVFSLPALP